jgi:hypothetical protein
MRLPNAEQARVAPEKTWGYLLDTGHPDGGPKADFFLRFGFTRERWQIFADALRAHALVNEVIDIEETPNGMKYVVDGILETPDGRNPRAWTVWMLSGDSNTPRFVTAYPARR